jgi:hypothetical protein
LFAQTGDLGAQRGRLLLQLGSLAVSVGGDLACPFLRFFGHLPHAFVSLLDERVNLASALVEQLHAFLKQTRRLRKPPSLLPRPWHRQAILRWRISRKLHR